MKMKHILLYYILSVYIQWLAVAEFRCIIFDVFFFQVLQWKTNRNKFSNIENKFQNYLQKIASNTLS